MAAVDRRHIWKAGTAMSLPDNVGRLSARSKKAPVRVKLERINCDVGKLHPPEGDRHTWIDRLKTALGTASIEFVDATLYQLQAAARLPNSGGVGDRSQRRARHDRERAAKGRNRMRDRGPNGLRAFGNDGRSRPTRWRTRWRPTRPGRSDSGKSVITHFRDLG